MRINDGIVVEIKGDHSALKADMKEARDIVSGSATGMSNALANALSPEHISRGVNSLVANLSSLQRHSKLTGKEFSNIGVDLKELTRLTGMSEKEFGRLQSRMMQTKAAKEQERVMRALERQLNLTRGESARLRAQLGDVRGAASAYLGIVGDRLQTVTNRIFSLKSAVVGLGLGYLGANTLATAANFESLQISLETVTGSSQAAQQAMRWIEDFTKRTPFELDQVADAFRRLAAYGLEPTKYLQTLGDTASAMGKTLEQAVEMFADAATGEFERLKEFGIKAKTEGDQVTFSWVQNGEQMTKTAKKTGVAITEALGQILSRFEGGMERQSQSWNGLWSNLMDQWSMFQKRVMDSGPFQEMKRQLKEFLSYLETAEGKNALRDWATATGKSIKNVVEGLDGLIEKLQKLKAMWDAIPTPLKGALIGGIGGLATTRNLYVAGGGAALGFGAGLAQWDYDRKHQDKAGDAKLPSQITTEDFGLPSDADFNQIYEKYQELEQKAQDLQAKAEQFWKEVLSTTAPGTGERKEASQRHTQMLQEVAALEEMVYRLGQLHAGHKTGEVKSAAAATEQVTDKILKARTKLANQLELLGADSAQKERIRLEQQLQENLKASGGSALAWQVYYVSLAELREKDLVESRAAEEKRRKDFIKSDVALRENLERLAEKGLSDKERELRELERQYEKHYQQLDDWATDYIGQFGDTEEATLRILQEYEDKKAQIDRAYWRERQELSKSGLRRLLDEWADFSQGWQDIGKNFLEGLQQSWFNTFRNIFENVGGWWENLMSGMKSVAYQAFAAIASRLATVFMARGMLSLFPGLGMSLGDLAGGDKSGAGLSLGGGKDFLSGFWDWLTKSGDSSPAGDWAGINSDISGGFKWGEWFGGGGFGVGNALGLAGGLYGLFNAYQSGNPLTGLFSGAAAGTSILPGWGTLIGGGIGLLTGLFGGDDGPSSGELGWMQFQQDLQKLQDQDQGEIDLSTYLDTFRQFHQSDNRARQAGWTPEKIEALMREKMGDKWEWWMPTAQLAGDRQDFEGTQNKEYWQRATTGHLMGQAFGGEKGGDWAKDNLDQINEILSDLPDEAVAALGESLSNLQDAAGMFGMSLEDLFQDVDMAKLRSGEWASVLKDHLAPASLMARMEDKLRAEGLNELEIATKKQAAIIDTLLGSFNMGEGDTDAWIEQLLNANAQQADLSAKMAEYQDIVEQLKKLRAGEEDKAKDLIKRGRELRDELGLGESAFNKVEKSMENIAKTLDEKTLPALERLIKLITGAAGGHDDQNAHQGGLIRHGGGLVDQALAAGFITPHGGMTRMHWGGLRPDERWVLALRDEFVMQPSAVKNLGLGFMRAANQSDVHGMLAALSQRSLYADGLMEAMQIPAGRAGSLPAPAAAPQSKEPGKVVRINLNGPLVSFDGASFAADPEETRRAAYEGALRALEDIAESGAQPGATATVRASW